jgi:hypothetical protein
MHIKVRGGTVSEGEPALCATCRYATVIRGRSLREEIVECSQLADGHGRITFPVTRCAKYLHRPGEETEQASQIGLDEPPAHRLASYLEG